MNLILRDKGGRYDSWLRRGANCPIIGVSSFVEGVVCHGVRSFPVRSTRSWEEARAEKSAATHGALKSIAIDGAGTHRSAERRWYFFCHKPGKVYQVWKMKKNIASRLVN